MGELYAYEELFRQNNRGSKSNKSDNSGYDASQRDSNVISYDSFIRKRSEKQDIPILHFAIVDYSSPKTIDSIAQEIGEPSQVFLPLFKRQIENPLFTDYPDFFTALFKAYSDAQFFPTLTPETYRLHRYVSPDFFRQFGNMPRAQYERIRIEELMSGFSSSSDVSVFVGNLEEVVHLLNQIDFSEERGFAHHKFIPKVPELTAYQKKFLSYLKNLKRAIVELDAERVPLPPGWFRIRKYIRLNEFQRSQFSVMSREWKKVFDGPVPSIDEFVDFSSSE